MRADFTIHHEPFGKQRPKFSTFNGHATARTPQETVIFENLVRMEYQQQCAGIRFADNAQICVKIKAYYPMPKASMKKTEAMLCGELQPTKKPDGDNVIKAVLDSLNKLAYRDDAQIVDTSIVKYFSNAPRVEVSMWDKGEKVPPTLTLEQWLSDDTAQNFVIAALRYSLRRNTYQCKDGCEMFGALIPIMPDRMILLGREDCKREMEFRDKLASAISDIDMPFIRELYGRLMQEIGDRELIDEVTW